MSADVGAVAGGHGVTDAMVEAAAVELWDYDERHHASWAETAEGFQFAFRVEVRRALAAALATQPNVPTPQQVEAAARERDVDRNWCLLKAEEYHERAATPPSNGSRIDRILAERYERLAALCAAGGRGGAGRAEGPTDSERLADMTRWADSCSETMMIIARGVVEALHGTPDDDPVALAKTRWQELIDAEPTMPVAALINEMRWFGYGFTCTAMHNDGGDVTFCAQFGTALPGYGPTLDAAVRVAANLTHAKSPATSAARGAR